jgi:cation diffusion facilitator family transporter
MSTSHEAFGPLVAAFLGNVAIAVMKAIAAVFTGSSAMLAESAHSLADSINQVLIFVGIRRAGRARDILHPFGHGKEVYFWSFLVAIGIFAGGSAFSLYEGVHRLVDPVQATGSSLWAYGVLLGSILFEGVSFTVAIRAFRRSASTDGGMLRAIVDSRDPALFTVVLEDSAAMAGLVIALGGVALADLTGLEAFDASASILIGLLLAGVACLLGREVHSMLLGESAHPAMERAVAAAVAAGPEVAEVCDLRTLQMGPDAVYVMIEARIDASAHGGDTTAAVDEVERRIYAAVPMVRKVFLEPQSAAGAAAERDGRAS